MHYRGLFVGLTTVDIQYFVDEFPNRNTKVKTNAPDILIGGPATNAAVAFSYLNNGAHLATVVGENSFTSFIENDFLETNVELIDIAKSQKLNPIVASVVTSGTGDRTIFTHNPPEINPVLTAEILFQKINPEILLCDGFYPEISIECAKLAKAKNITVVIDGGSWKPQYEELLKYTDIVICSADFYPPGCNNSADVFDYLFSRNIKKVAISRGERSILFKDCDKRGEIAIDTIEVVDTLGAGDFLHGAFCYYFSENADLEYAILHASKLASESCCCKGTRNWLKK